MVDGQHPSPEEAARGVAGVHPRPPQQATNALHRRRRFAHFLGIFLFLVLVFILVVFLVFTLAVLLIFLLVLLVLVHCIAAPPLLATLPLRRGDEAMRAQQRREAPSLPERAENGLRHRRRHGTLAGDFPRA